MALENAIRKVPSPPYELLTDNGKEFVGKDFESVLQKYSIHHRLTAPYTPELNGKMERFWKILEDAYPHTRPFREWLIDAISEYNNVWIHSSIKKRITKI